MDIRFIASFAVISSDPAVDRSLFVDPLGLDLHGPEGVEGSSYLYTEAIEGAKHFGVWPLAEAAEACFGTTDWPDSHPVPQASVEFEVDDVDAAVNELLDGGHVLLHPTRTEPWGQVVARVQANDGAVVGVCFTPHLREPS